MFRNTFVTILDKNVQNINDIRISVQFFDKNAKNKNKTQNHRNRSLAVITLDN